MAAPVPTAAATAKRGRESGPPLAPLARWDYLLAGARKAGDRALRAWKDEQAADMFESEGWEAGENEDEYDTDKYQSEFTDGFTAFITEAMPDLTDDERLLVIADAQLEWTAFFEFLQHGAVETIYDFLVDSFESVGDFNNPDKYAIFTHCVRRIRRIPLERQLDGAYQQRDVWDELMGYAQFARGNSDRYFAAAGSRGTTAFANGFYDLLRAVLTPEEERARFDASQIERHMSMVHRVPADVSNLVGQFATTGITAQAPIPMRLQVKHRLELLSRRVASLAPETAASELRAILADVEEALPIRNKKKPRPSPAAAAAAAAAPAPDGSDDEDRPIAPRQQPRK